MAEALLRGISALFRPRLLLIYWLLSVLLSVAVLIGYEATVFDAMRQLPEPGALAAEPASPWTDDFSRANGATLAVLGQGAGVAVWLWILATTLLSGGLVRAFEQRAIDRRKREGEAWGLRVFLADAGQFAFRMLRLLLVTLVLAHAADWLFNDVFATWHGESLDVTESERFSVITDWMRQGLFALVIFGLAIWSDVARVQVVIEQRGSVLGGLVSAANALLVRPVEMLGLGAFFVAVEWIAMALFAVALGRVRTDSPEQLGWWLLGSQALILLRLGLGFARIAAYTAVAEDLRSESEARLSPGRAGTA
jgi:hypothetical protein